MRYRENLQSKLEKITVLGLKRDITDPKPNKI